MQTIGGPAAPLRPALPERTRLLLEGPVLPTLLRLAAPNVGEAAARIAFIACDALFVAWLGTDALAGVSLVFPIFLVMQMMSAGGLGAGVAAAVARAMGAGRREEAEAVAAHGVLLAVLLAALFAIVMLLDGPALYRAMGAEGASLDAAILYSNLLFAGGVAVWLMNTLANAVRGTGNMIVPAGAIVAGEAVHLALSPALILGFGPFPQLGVAGAAIAILACYATGSAILLAYLLSGRSALRLTRAAFRPRRAQAAAILRVGAPSGLNVVQFQLTTLAITGLVAGFGAEAVAGFGAATRLELLQIPILFALGSAVIAMVATNMGAGELARARRIAWTGVGLSVLIGGDFGRAAPRLRGSWVALFTDPPAVARAGAAYLRAVGPAYPFLALGLGLFFAAQGAGRAGMPFLIGTVRLAFVAAGGGLVVTMWAGGPTDLFLLVAASSVVFGLGMLAVTRPMFGGGARPASALGRPAAAQAR